MQTLAEWFFFFPLFSSFFFFWLQALRKLKTLANHYGDRTQISVANMTVIQTLQNVTKQANNNNPQ